MPEICHGREAGTHHSQGAGGSTADWPYTAVWGWDLPLPRPSLLPCQPLTSRFTDRSFLHVNAKPRQVLGSPLYKSRLQEVKQLPQAHQSAWDPSLCPCHTAILGPPSRCLEPPATGRARPSLTIRTLGGTGYGLDLLYWLFDLFRQRIYSFHQL